MDASGTAPSSGSPARSSPGRKGAIRRDQILDNALACLTTKGYADTSMRDIAAAAGLNLGRLHYYFDSRAELLLAALLRYKGLFVDGLSEILERGHVGPGLLTAVAEANAAAAIDNARVHRLWYDVKARSMFDTTLLAQVDAIETDLQTLLGDILARLGGPVDSRRLGIAFAALDGIFMWGVLSSIRGTADRAEFLARFEGVMRQTLKASARQPTAARTARR